ncbi:unnamed protein product [Trichobilharzia szidati]|nr:unnamed protein product [Trichobilharzia szidati]
MGSDKPRRSLFHRIADSITGFVPSSILPNANVTSWKNCEFSDTKTGLKRTNESVEIGGELEPSSKLSRSRDHPAFTSVDLDATDHSESDFSLRSFSTSGVSSLMPRSWLPGPKPEQKQGTTVFTPRLYSNHSCATTNGCHTLKNDACEEPLLLNTSWDYSGSTFPTPKRQKLSATSSLSPACTYRPRMGTTYGGAASCRSVRELFQFTTPLKFELCKEQNSQESNPNANISSTARRILETLEHFSAPLTSGISQSNRPRHIKRVKVPTRCHRFPPFSGDYQKMKMLSNEYERRHLQESEHSNMTHSETETQPPKCYGASAFNEKQVDKCDTSKSTDGLATSTAGLCRKLTEKLSPSFTFSDPIHKICGSDSELVSSYSTDQRYVFSCPSRSCTKCSSQSLDFLQRSSVLQSVSQVDSPDKSKNMSAWRCETCLLENIDSSVTCKGCSIPKPNLLQCTKVTCPPSISLPSSTVAPLIDVVPVTTNSAVNWECPTCLVFNEPKETKCVCCQTSKPATKMKGSWECPTCMVQNDNELDKCPCCSTDKPGSRPDKKTLTGTISFPTLTSVPPGNFKFGFNLPTATNFKESNAVTSSGATVIPVHSVASSKNVGFSFGVNENVSSQSEQIVSPSCTSSQSQDDNTMQIKPSMQLGIAKNEETKGAAENFFSGAVSGPKTSSFLQKSDIIPEMSCSKGFVFGSELPSGTGKTNLFTFGSCSASGINGFTPTPPSTNFSDSINGGVFQFGTSNTISGNLPSSNLSSTPIFSNHFADENVEVRKKVHAVRRLRR